MRSLGDVAFSLWDWLGPRVVLDHRSRGAQAFGGFGERAVVCFPPAALFGQSAIHIGAETVVGPWVSLSVGMVPGQPLVSDRILVIGKRCLIGRGSSLVAHRSIEIGDDVFFGPNVYVTDQNHDNTDPAKPVGAQHATEKPVVIGDGSWIGTNAVILPGVRIGRNATVGAGAVVTRDVPDHAVAVGNPARLLPGPATRSDGAESPQRPTSDRSAE